MKKETSFLDNVKSNLQEVTECEWRSNMSETKKLPREAKDAKRADRCRGNTSEFFKIYLNSLPKLNRKKFFWVDGNTHTYVVYDEDGEIGNTLDLSPNEAPESQLKIRRKPDEDNDEEKSLRRLLIDPTHYFIGLLRDGYVGVEEPENPYNELVEYDKSTRQVLLYNEDDLPF
jgi:hypothetical protein